MRIDRNFSAADPDEDEVYTFDFLKDLPEGDTVSTSIWSCDVVSGVDADAASHLIGSPSTGGSKTSHRISGLLPGVEYRLRALVTTAAGSKLSLYAHVPCRALS